MHNSEDGTTVVEAGTGAEWDAGVLSSGSVNTPQVALLKTDCVGCHSSAQGATILNIGGNLIPIVNNGVTPVNELAGGNFFHLADKGTQYGHNVWGISGIDGNLSWAPGAFDEFGNIPGTGCAQGCHDSMARDPALIGVDDLNGCQSCHSSAAHHRNNANGNVPVTAANGGYRFLSGPAGGAHEGVVSGKEDPSGTWEQVPTVANHNTYSLDANYAFGDNPQSISDFCAGCHSSFHAANTGPNFGNIDNNPTGSAWLRHPSDFVIPNTGEYAGVIGQPYNPQIPVGKTALIPTPPAATVQLNDGVICMSCHRAHASAQPDMLRFTYDMIAHNGASSAGCFFCHTLKDV